MHEGSLKAQWMQTSSIMALLANIHRDPKKRRKAYRPDDFNPMTGPGKTKGGYEVSADQFFGALTGKPWSPPEASRPAPLSSS